MPPAPAFDLLEDERGTERLRRYYAPYLVALAAAYAGLGERLPRLNVLGGCCGTDHRHVAAIRDAWLQRAVSRL